MKCDAHNSHASFFLLKKNKKNVPCPKNFHIFRLLENKKQMKKRMLLT